MFGYGDRAGIEDLEGETFTNVEYHDDEKVTFETEGRELYRMYHRQDCCEHVRVEGIVGNLDRLHGEEIVRAEKETWRNENPPAAPNTGYLWGSFTWTYFMFETEESIVTIQWLGESNGYYYEGVEIARMIEDTAKV